MGRKGRRMGHKGRRMGRRRGRTRGQVQGDGIVTDIDTARLRELLAKATQGDWKTGNMDFYVEGDDGDDLVLGAIGVSSGFRSHVYSVLRGKRTFPEQKANLESIVALHNAAPALLDEIDCLRDELAEVRWALAQCMKGQTDD